MTELSIIKRLCAHMTWADNEILRALRATSSIPDGALREFGHVIAAAEVWLSRLQGRAPAVTVWPALYLDDIEALASKVHTAYERYMASLSEADLSAVIAYKTSAGQPFENRVDDILMHVAMHGQYHRGKVNLLLRQAGAAPAPTDFIAMIRGAPAATQRLKREA
jgi:uncharacterized damage-inducible protein DinB